MGIRPDRRAGAAQVPRQQHGLDMGQQADFHFFLQIGVDDFFLFLGLQGLKQQLMHFIFFVVSF